MSSSAASCLLHRAVSHLLATPSGSAWSSLACHPLARCARGFAAKPAHQADANAEDAPVAQHQQRPEGRESIQQIRDRIFGPSVTGRQKDGRQILARKMQGSEIASWYFLPPTEQPGFHNEEREYVLQRNQNRRKKPEKEEGAPKSKKGKK